MWLFRCYVHQLVSKCVCVLLLSQVLDSGLTGFFTEHNCLLCLRPMLLKAMWVHKTTKVADQKNEMKDVEMFISTECNCTLRWQNFLWVFVMTNMHIHLTNCKISILVGAVCAAVKHRDPILSLRLHCADTSEREAVVSETEIAFKLF